MTLMERTRTRLLLDHPFFGSLAMELAMVEDRTVPIARTDGKVLQWNPEAWEPLSMADRKFVLAHEVMHCALLHPWRCNNLDQELANRAADYVVNGLLKEAGFDILKGCLYDKRFDDMSMEQVYSRLKSEAKPKPGDEQGDQPGGNQSGQDQSKQGKQAPGQSGGSPDTTQGQKTSPRGGKPAQTGGPESPTGDFVPAPEPEPGEPDPETQWKLAAEGVLQVCRSAGTMPGGAEAAVKATREPRVDWITETREFLTNSSPTEQTWARGARRFLADDIYLPGSKRESVGRLVVAVDCSGSCWSITPKFTSELQGLLREARPENVTVIYWDTKVRGVEEFGPDEFDVTLQTKGGGGTMFGKVLEYIDSEQLDPAGLIVLTDLYIGDTGKLQEPNYPVLWTVPEFQTDDGPFGKTVRILEGE